MFNLKNRVIGAPLLAATTVLATAVPSQAETSGPSTATPVTSVMKIVGYDTEVAQAHGYEIVPAKNGTQTSVATGASAVVAPQVTLGGDCGASSVVLADDDHGHAAVSTGFNLNRPAVGYTWAVNVAGGGSGYTKQWSGGLALRKTWTASFNWTVPRNGQYIAGVTSGSYAIMADGGICSSNMPVDSE